MTAQPTRSGQRSRAIQLMITAPLITSLLVYTQHLMTAQLTVQWTPLPLRYHLTTYTYKNTFIIINNNKTYLIIQTKTRPHTPSRAITSFSQQEHQAFSQQELSFLTGGAPAKPSYSRSTIQTFSQQEYSAFSHHEHQASSQ